MSLLLNSLPKEFVTDYVLNQTSLEDLATKYHTTPAEIERLRVVLLVTGISPGEGVLGPPEGFESLLRSPDEKIQHNITGTEWTLLGVTRIRTLPELITMANVDPRDWEVKECEFKKWDGMAKNKRTQTFMGIELWAVRAKFVKKVQIINARQELDELVEYMKGFSTSFLRIPREPSQSRSKKLLEISIADLHAGKLAEKEECGEDYDVSLAETAHQLALDNILTAFRHIDIDRVLLVVGNDLFNADNLENTTTHGTPQTTDSRYYRTFRRVWKLIIRSVEQLLQIADVDVIMVPGNHDQQTVFHLGELLTVAFHQHPNVRIDNRACLRKYYEWGAGMIQFTHGNEERHKSLANLAAEEQPEMWARTRYRESHVAHTHARKQMSVKEEEEVGFLVRTIPSLSATEDWHASKGYVGNVRCAIGIIWDWDTGPTDWHQYTHQRPKVLGVPSPLTNFEPLQNFSSGETTTSEFDMNFTDM